MSEPGVQEHFTRAADRYVARAGRGLLGWLRRRERAVLAGLLAPGPEDSVLDAGCGAGYDAGWLLPRAREVIGVDVSAAMLAEAERRGESVTLMDLAELDLGRRFDKVLCAGALEFCESPARVIGRLAAHLEPHGRLLLLVPSRTLGGRVYRAYHRSHGVPVRLFDSDQIDAWLRQAGLEVRVVVDVTPISFVVCAEPRARV